VSTSTSSRCRGQLGHWRLAVASALASRPTVVRPPADDVRAVGVEDVSGPHVVRNGLKWRGQSHARVSAVNEPGLETVTRPSRHHFSC
jgi:hypothetical protein